MSAPKSKPPATVSLADEEAVRRILVDTLFGLVARSVFDGEGILIASRLPRSREDPYWRG